MAPGDELVEVVDDDGGVVRIVTRREMRAANLRHRAVFVVVRSGSRLLAHRRAAWKDVWPGYWDVAVGGVVGVGEAWVDAARRELAEELGLHVETADLHRLGAGSYADGDVRLAGEVFEVVAGGPFRFADGEVSAVEWVDADRLDGWLAGRAVVPDSLALVVPHLSPA